MNRHINQNTLELNLPSAAGSQQGVAIIAVHGRNQNPQFMWEQLQLLGWGYYPALLPAAADASWYPDKFMAPIEKNEEALDDALKMIWIMHSQLLSLGFRNEQIVLIGFSQGACLLSQYVLTTPVRFKAVALLTGGYLGPEGVDWKFRGDLEETPIYISTANNDECVPPARVEETAMVLKNMNANVKVDIFDERPHEISAIEIERLKELL